MTAGPAAPAGVIVATHTVMDGLVIRWHHVPNGDAVVSASRNHVMIHGDAIVTDKLMLWIGAAQHARDLIRSGREDEVKAMATHKHASTFGRDLVPLQPAEAQQ